MLGGSPYNNWGLAGGLGSLTLNNYSVTMPNSHHFSDESDSSGTARTVPGNSSEFDLGSRSRVHYSENFEDTPYVPPRSDQPHPYPTHTHTHTHTSPHNASSDGHTVSTLNEHIYFTFFSYNLFFSFQFPSPAESHNSVESNWSSSSSSDQSQQSLVHYTSQHHPQFQQYHPSHSRHNEPQQYPTFHPVHRLGLEHSHFPAQPSAALHYPPPEHSPYSGNILAPELHHDQLNQELSILNSHPGASTQTFSVSLVADDRSNHLLFEDAGPYLRETLRIPPYQDINLWALPDPPEGEKPNQPYPILIKLAIYGSPHKQLTLQEIYTALEDRFQWFRVRRNEKAWKVGFQTRSSRNVTHLYAQNSIRHNLSLNKVFKRVPRAVTEPGKGSYWQLDCSDGEGYKRTRKRRSKSARATFDQGDDDYSEGDESPSISVAPPSNAVHHHSPAASDDSYIDPELRQGSHVVGEGRTRSGSRRAGATNPYQSPRYQTQLLPQDSAPRFGQSSFGQAPLGRPGLGQTQPRGPVSSVPGPSAFMSSSPATFGPVPATSSRSDAPVIQHTLRPGIVVRDEGGLPSARRVQSYPQSHSSQESMSSQRSGSG